MKKVGILLTVLLLMLSISYFSISEYNIEPNHSSIERFVNTEYNKKINIMATEKYEGYLVVFFKTESDLDWGVTILKEGINKKLRIDYFRYSNSTATVKKVIYNDVIEDITIIASENKDHIVDYISHSFVDNSVREILSEGPFIRVLDDPKMASSTELLFVTKDGEDVRDVDRKKNRTPNGYARTDSRGRMINLELVVVIVIQLIFAVIILRHIKRK